MSNANPYQPKVGDTVWIAEENYHVSGVVTEITETTAGNLYYVMPKSNVERYATRVYREEAGALLALIDQAELTLSMARAKLAWLEQQPKPLTSIAA